MADQDIVRPHVTTCHRNGYHTLRGIDASIPRHERFAQEFDQAPSAEDLVRVVWRAIEAGCVFFTTTERWIRFNPAMIVDVECRSFE